MLARGAALVALGAIDREAVVRRHAIELRFGEHTNPYGYHETLTVGNGVVGYNADATGMQSLNSTYKTFPLCTLSDWGWHSSPPVDPNIFADYPYKIFNTSNGRSVPYPLNNQQQYYWLRENPHRLDLIQVGLRRLSATFAPLLPTDIEGATATQVLDPWTGILTSTFSVSSNPTTSFEFVARGTCSPAGSWYSLSKDGQHNPITVAASSSRATSCPPLSSSSSAFDSVAGFVADSLHAWKNDTLCTYTSNSTTGSGLWYEQQHGKTLGGWSGYFGAVQGKGIGECDSIGWENGARWCRSSSFDACRKATPVPALTPVPPPAPTSFTPVTTSTAMHMDLDILAWRVESAALSPSPVSSLADTPADAVVVRIAFPYGSTASNGPGHDWDNDHAHSTTIVAQTGDSVLLRRKLDYDEYEVRCRWNASARLSVTLKRDGPHSFVLQPRDTHAAADAGAAGAGGVPSLELSCLLAPPSARYPISRDSGWLVAKAEATRSLLAGQQPLPLYAAVSDASASAWGDFWRSGAFVDLSKGKNDTGERSSGGGGGGGGPLVCHGGAVFASGAALELERRVVLSQYLTRSQSAGSTPPQETGYTLNSWYGKHHHEMRWWHQAHFALWQRPELLQRADGWFVDMLPNATAYAHFQGYEGARWPKMVGPAVTPLSNPDNCAGMQCYDKASVGNTTYSNGSYPLLYWTGPSSTGPMLIWQQPHIVWMVELQRLHADTPAAAAAVVRRMSEVVEATADFMASYPAPPPPNATDGEQQRGENGEGGEGELWLGPPTDGGEEGNPITETWNPTFELTYWRLGLKIASEWKQRAGQPVPDAWKKAMAGLAKPTVLDGDEGGEMAKAYAINANCWGFPIKDKPIAGKHKCSGAYGSHPLVLGSLGMINGAAVSPPIDPKIMNATVAYSIKGWDWKGTWGWDYPLWAFAMMRLEWSPSSVVSMLLRNETKNFYFANGHDYETPYLPCYLPGNGGLLSAVAMMAGGYTNGDGAHRLVGFPEEWGARSEGFKAYP